MIATERGSPLTDSTTWTPAFVYGLVCPLESIIRYVGVTCDPIARYKTHTARSHNRGVREWIRDLSERELEPGFVILQVVDDPEALDIERRWIDHFRIACGDRLLNGPSGRPKSETGGSDAPQHSIRFTDPSEYETFRQLAERSDRPFGQWVRRTLRKAVDAGIADGQEAKR